ncbi:MAG: hypothetical protein DRH20_04705 [Deltaproteobacteria bacterium]|nr:class I SAM-dependent methyltransferase [Deltaproteobacteria bacterium]RLB38928.1 MAG: hypothetical protein DRH20_04705 [Deltaproteobacteria bacterium]
MPVFGRPPMIRSVTRAQGVPIMACVFDENTARIYETWCRSPQGRAVERAAEEMLLRLLHPRPGQRVLDVGCGSGNHLLILNRLGLDITGLDASPTMIRRAGERLGQRCELRLGRAEDLPFEDNAFDVVIMIHTLEFLADPVAALREAGRVASSKVFLGVMNSLSLEGLMGRARGYFKDSFYGRARMYNLWQIKGYLTRALGDVPIAWLCTPWKGAAPDHAGVSGKRVRLFGKSPFGPFIGAAATLLYRVRTDNLHLKLRVKEAGGSVVGAETFGLIHRVKGEGRDERGLSV